MCSENQVGMNSVKTKDYTYCNLTTTPEVFWWVQKGLLLVWAFVNFQELFRFWNKLRNSSNTVCIQSEVKCIFTDRHCCTNMAKACHVLSCLKLYFTFDLLGTIIILCQKTGCNVFLHLLKGCMFTESVHILGFYDELFYHYLKRLGSYLLLENEGENWKAGLWK